MKKYLYQYESWPNFTWDEAALAVRLAEIPLIQGRLLGRLDYLGFTLRTQTTLNTLTDEIVNSSAIEGEHLDTDEVRSSVARKLGIETAGMVPSGHRVDGVVDLMLDATQNYLEPFSEERLFGWQAALFPSGFSGLYRITVGKYRSEEMQVVSGPAGKEKIHYEAPSFEVVPGEMKRFIDWCNAKPDIAPLIKAAVAHLWFVIIHPFDDGNGRLARAITEKLLARSDKSSDRYYSISTQILDERKEYYAALNKAQYSDSDITSWLDWFIGCIHRALEKSLAALDSVIAKAEFWDYHRDAGFNQRQQRMLNMLLDGFQGNLTSTKWGKITKTSHDTALRDIQDLIDRGILEKTPAGGRSTAYCLVTQIIKN